MAKKTVATLQTGSGKDFIKCIKPVREKGKKAYTFEQRMVHKDNVSEFFKKK